MFCRVRPVLPVERKSGQDVNVTNFPLEDELEVLQVGLHCSCCIRSWGSCANLSSSVAWFLCCGRQDSSGTMSKRFEFDRVFRPASTQEEVFNEVGWC